MAQMFNPYGIDNLFTYISTSNPEWKACRKAFAKSMSPENLRCCPASSLGRTSLPTPSFHNLALHDIPVLRLCMTRVPWR